MVDQLFMINVINGLPPICINPYSYYTRTFAFKELLSL